MTGLFRSIVAIIWIAIVSAAGVTSAVAEKRVALVIGNSRYLNTQPLPNPGNDAEDVAAALRRFGFEIIEARDLDKRGMDLAIARFGRAVQDADAALFFYAGHGMQFSGSNFLMPVDAKLEDEFSVTFEMSRLDDVVSAMSRAKGVKIVILDACRNNPLAEQMKSRSITRDLGATRGLAKLEGARGMLTAFATQPNDVAADGQDRNSPFTRAFLKELGDGRQEIGLLFRRVTAEVNRATNGKQLPNISDSLIGEFFFAKTESDLQTWERIRQGNDRGAVVAFLEKFPTSVLADAARGKLAALDRETSEKARLEREAAEAAARERAERERLAREAAERERLAKEQAERERIAKERAERERIAQALAAQVRLQQELAEKARQEREAMLKQIEQREREAREAADRLRRELAGLTAPAGTPPPAPPGGSVLPPDAIRPQTPPPAGTVPPLAPIQPQTPVIGAPPTIPPIGPVAVLVPPSGKAPVGEKPAEIAVTPALTGAPLIVAIKTELTRLGCYVGPLDGRWGNGPTTRALADFAKHAGLPTPPSDPAATFLDLLKSKPDRVCPLVCGPNQTVIGGICVAVAAPPVVRPPRPVVAPKPPVVRPPPVVVRPPPPAAKPRPVAERPRPVVRPRAERPSGGGGGGGGGGRCFSFNGQRFCE